MAKVTFAIDVDQTSYVVPNAQQPVQLQFSLKF